MKKIKYTPDAADKMRALKLTISQEYGTNKAKKIIKSINARGEEQSIPCNMINCFCMYSDYVPLTLDEWIELFIPMMWRYRSEAGTGVAGRCGLKPM